MDPEAALSTAEQHIAWLQAGQPYGSKARAREALAAYKEWRQRGGFEPTNGDARAKAIAKALRTTATKGANRTGAKLFAYEVILVDAGGRPLGRENFHAKDMDAAHKRFLRLLPIEMREHAYVAGGYLKRDKEND